VRLRSRARRGGDGAWPGRGGDAWPGHGGGAWLGRSGGSPTMESIKREMEKKIRKRGRVGWGP
jgi:hypothetical protein